MRLILAGVVMLLMAVPALAQAQASATQQEDSTNPVLGRGRGGVPFAWNDQNKDGICDLTGQPVGQGRRNGSGRDQRDGARGFAWGDRDGDGACDYTGQAVRTGSRGRARGF